jgi:Tol biopolymer transport system component
MIPRSLAVFALFSVSCAWISAQQPEPLLSNIRQVTFEGKRAGEGYFGASGKQMIFQSEREEKNPFFQIYVLDFDSGETRRISPGSGKTTCAWLHPDGRHCIFASTHQDKDALLKQEQELKSRSEGKQKRYAWDYDENYDIFEAEMGGKIVKNLTGTLGYDAECAMSPDGAWIVFASNRHAYKDALTKEEKEHFDRQKSWLMDIYLMRSDGTDVRRLTDARGYDGGPFFSADGRRICWRRFNEEEDRAEIWTMNADGSGQKQITRLDAMSWAPFFHPSGQYLVFATNKHGFDNFEIYMVDAEGKHEPERVTNTTGFDGLPSFSPDGKRLTWTSGRTADKSSQIFLAEWDHAAALDMLGLSGGAAAAPDIAHMTADISAEDIRRHVAYLASDELGGRLTGTKGELLATGYVAEALKNLGLEPAGDRGAYFAPFEFTAGVALGEANSLTWDSQSPKPQSDWTPLAFSSTGAFAAAGVVFAGYGVEVPASTDDKGQRREEYSSYAHLDVKGKWVLIFRYVPEGLSPEERVRFQRYATLRKKAMTAREKGAAGMIVVSGPAAKVVDQLVPLSFDASMAGSGLAAVSVIDSLADGWLKMAGKDLKSLQELLDKGEMAQGFEIPGLKVAAHIDIRQEKKTGRNVIARLKAAEPGNEPPLVIGAHIDHLGSQGGPDSMATGADKNAIHHGADDNASGVAGMMEIAQWLSRQSADGQFKPKRDVIFAAWSGEELGLLGSTAWLKGIAKAGGDENARLTGKICANLNMDMIGRMKKSVILQGLGSSEYWAKAIERRNLMAGLSIQAQNDCFVSTDATSFYLRGIPIFNAFTGAHEDYHKPSDTPEKLNYEGAARIAHFMALVARDLATSEEEPAYREVKRPEEGARTGFRVFLGTIPDYSQSEGEGVKLSGVAPAGPAAKAGIQAGDVIVKLAGRDIKNIYEYTDVLGALKVGQETSISVRRGDKTLDLKITPGSRE